jgi:DNA modification methylase
LHVEILEEFTAEGAVILDPFLGSGTTLIACEQAGRACYGVEFEPGYCDIIIERWERLTGREAVKIEN